MATPNVAAEFPSLALIRQGVDQRFKLRCRGLELVVRPLSIFEEDQIAQEVMAEMDKVTHKTSLRESALLSIKKLERAQSAAPGSLDGVKVHAIELQQFTAGELDSLFKQYIAGCEKTNPMLERLSAEELEKIVEHLKKNTKEREMTLIESSFFHLVDLCLHLLSTEASPTDK